MSFEFWFGVFGLISGDSTRRHKMRLESDWRLNMPLGASLFREAMGNRKSRPDSFADTPLDSSSDGRGRQAAGQQQQQQQQQQEIFSTGAQQAAIPAAIGDGVLSLNSSSSASSVASLGSTNTLIKPSSQWPPFTLDSSLTGRKYKTLELSASSAKLAGADAGARPQLAGSMLPDDLAGSFDGLNGARSDSGKLAGGEDSGKGGGLSAVYCRVVCLFLFIQTLRLVAAFVLNKSIITLDFYYLGAFRIHFLIPCLCLAIQSAAVSVIFIRNNDETNWLVPFYSSKDYLIRSRSNFRPQMDTYSRRIRISICLALVLATMSALAIPLYLAHAAQKPAPNLALRSQSAEVHWSNLEHLGLSWAERVCLNLLLLLDVIWAIYSTFVCFLVSFYFNLICSILKTRFHGISKIIEELAESNTSKTTNQSHKITTLYLEHNEACELLDESNDFWQYLIFFTYFTYIPAYCYCLYNLFFVDFDAWPSFITWIIHNHTGFIILLISFSASGVSTEAHAPYTSLHTLSLIQLPLDVEVNIATFLHRVRGLTIGYSCYDLFAITNASMSNTAAACASYFLIVADFSRSSVFNLAQMNGTGAGQPPALGQLDNATGAPALAG